MDAEFNKQLDELEKEDDQKLASFEYCQDKKHAWCKYTEYMKLFYFNYLESPLVFEPDGSGKFRNSMDEQLSECFDWYALSSIVEDFQLKFQNGSKVPGLYIMLLSNYANLREWALESLDSVGKIAGMDQMGIIQPILERITLRIESYLLGKSYQTYFTEDPIEFWIGLELLIRQFDSNIFKFGIVEYRKNFVDIMLNVLKIQAKPSISQNYLKCLSAVIDALQYDFWNYTNWKPILLIQDLCELIMNSKIEKVQQEALLLMGKISKHDNNTTDSSLRQFVIEFCFNRCAYPSTHFSSVTKNKAFLLVLRIMMYCFEAGLPIPSLEGWGERLVYNSLSEDLQYEYGAEVEFGFEPTQEQIDETLFSSIIANHVRWIDMFLIWGQTQIDSEWFDAFSMILREIIKNKLKIATPLMKYCQSVIDTNTPTLTDTQMASLKKYYYMLVPPTDKQQQQLLNASKPSPALSMVPLSTQSSYSTIQKEDCPLGLNCTKIRNPDHILRYRHVQLEKGYSGPTPNLPSKSMMVGGSFSMGRPSAAQGASAIDFNTPFDPFDQPLAKPIPAADKKKTKLLDNFGSSNSSFHQRREKARIAQMEAHLPKVEDLHKIILSWNVEMLNQVDANLKVLPTSFENLSEYIQIFQPLLLQEFKGQLLKAVEELEPSGTQYVLDDVAREGEFHVVLFFLDGDEEFSLEDLVLLQKEILGVKFEVFGKIENKGKKERKDKNSARCAYISVKFHQLEKIGLLKHMKIKTQWNIQKLTSLSTVNREYLALHLVGKIPLGSYIISPALAITNQERTNNVVIPPALHNKLLSELNSSQMEAIYHSLIPHGFTLLQGPPGTGKTKTIMALLSVLLSTPLDSKINSTAPPKILVCAPSNAAVDEIASRIIDGDMFDKDGNSYVPSAIRIGQPSAISRKVQQISLEYLLEKNSNDPSTSLNFEQSKIISVREKLAEINSSLESVKQKISTLQRSLGTSLGTATDSTRDLTTLYHEKDRLFKEIQATKDSEKKVSDVLESARKNMAHSLLNKCNIILSTLSGSGHQETFSAIKKFDVVIIDEAAQAVEPSTLIPLKHNVMKCILVGDPNQLPPTIISRMASQYQYETSLFQRLSSCGIPQQVLKVQYRMHPSISRFPSRHFYMNVLEDGPNVKNYTEEFYKDPRFGPFIFYDIYDSNEESGPGHSLKNVTEAKLVALLITNLENSFPNIKKSIGVITPYKQQVHEIKRRISPVNQDIDVSSVDGFQGREKDIIIFSCVRAHRGGTIGFLSDVRRMNVGLTRARSSLIVIGNSNLLKLNPDWEALVMHSINVLNGYFPISSKHIESNFLPMKPASNNVNFTNPNQAKPILKVKIKEMEELTKNDRPKENANRNGNGNGDVKAEKKITLESQHFEKYKNPDENEIDKDKEKDKDKKRKHEIDETIAVKKEKI
ncbi:putative splicing endonuclease [Heterostelium album PN500]|uniref:Putative splicing endonuclease n=1 Tax=Heterostelium pallidum (strain ATCC 26659 / Pp 5 / PN500) TaxID=670386 RepID=D3BNT8_HETP5|nr:putative splicing endonuclease [Heterostelium album PN500]EFA76857.1 putative splicing endonuclease [Heterostelium album PN500]|eukprot:XP_020428989.1 putative splicing endonuclease [Heterostelium album PN500]